VGTSTAKAGSYEEAAKKLSEAIVKETEVDRMTEEWLRKQVNPKIQAWLGYFAPAGQVLVERQVIIKWNF